MKNYNAKDYSDAIREFEAARGFAEKAEDAARIQRMKAGEEAL
jgi:hypothetical protein